MKRPDGNGESSSKAGEKSSEKRVEVDQSIEGTLGQAELSP